MEVNSVGAVVVAPNYQEKQVIYKVYDSPVEGKSKVEQITTDYTVYDRHGHTSSHARVHTILFLA